jgi:hypothetical protein
MHECSLTRHQQAALGTFEKKNFDRNGKQQKTENDDGVEQAEHGAQSTADTNRKKAEKNTQRQKARYGKAASRNKLADQIEQGGGGEHDDIPLIA